MFRGQMYIWGFSRPATTWLLMNVQWTHRLHEVKAMWATVTLTIVKLCSSSTLVVMSNRTIFFSNACPAQILTGTLEYVSFHLSVGFTIVKKRTWTSMMSVFTTNVSLEKKLMQDISWSWDQSVSLPQNI